MNSNKAPATSHTTGTAAATAGNKQHTAWPQFMICSERVSMFKFHDEAYIATDEDRHWWVVLYGSYWDYWVLRYFILINLIPPPLLPRPHYWIILANGKFYFTMASVGEDSDDWSWHSDWWISSIEISGDTQLLSTPALPNLPTWTRYLP